jgi:mevalonate kinase
VCSERWKLTKAFQKYKEEITSSLDPMERQVTTIKKALAQFDVRCGETSDQQATTKDKIHSTFKSLRGILDARETKLVSQLYEQNQGKLKSLTVQRNQIETALAQLNSCLHFMRESLKADDERDVLMMKTNTIKQVKELTAPF